MLEKIRKIYFYVIACHKGEILKRLEYKLKDIFKYFYIRNRFQRNINKCHLCKIELDMPDINIDMESKKYRIFNNEFMYNEMVKYLKTEKCFWRKENINKYEEIKIIWEYNRLQILLPMAIRYIKTGQEEYRDAITEILDYWNENNEFEYTINWNSNLEVAIRAINISLMLIFMKDDNLNKQYKSMLYLHGKHIFGEIEYSNCCIPNNHVIGEALALLILSNILDVREKKKWYNKAIKILKKYTDIIDEDGLSKENSFSYQFFVTKMYILSLCFINDKKLFNAINKIVIKSLQILKYTIINDDKILNYGDNDNGFLYSIYMTYNIAKDINEYYNLFIKGITDNETKIYLELINKLNHQNKIIIGKENEKNFIYNKKIFIYKNNKNILFFNAKKIEGHAHNDSLAIDFVIDGREIILDAGTYSYNKQKEIRRYYRDREAHSTILFKDKNAIPIGSFRWLNQNDSRLIKREETDNYIKVVGIIENICKRTITIYKDRKEIIIHDISKEHNIINNWILPNESILNDNIIIINNVKIKFLKYSIINVKKAKVSQRYLEEEEAKSYRVEYNGNEIITSIKWE